MAGQWQILGRTLGCPSGSCRTVVVVAPLPVVVAPLVVVVAPVVAPLPVVVVPLPVVVAPEQGPRINIQHVLSLPWQ